MKKIHVIGNSHVSIFSGASKIINCLPEKSIYRATDDIEYHAYHLGPTIAYNFFEHHYPIVRKIIEKNVDKENDYIMMAVGEVDCRWHLPKQAEFQNKKIELIVEECVSRFFRCYLECKENGYKCIGWGSHPSTNQGHSENPNSPVYKDVLTRNKISKEFETFLREKCQSNQMLFLSIFDDLLNKDGTTNMEYLIDYCHLKADKVLPMVTEKIKKII